MFPCGQNQMGHAKIEITFNLYGHILKETLGGPAQKTEDFVFKPSCPAPVLNERPSGIKPPSPSNFP
jgi:hypothetical protein